MGRLTRDPELRTTANQIPVCTFTLAVDRRFKNANGERQADFIPVVVWRKQAEFCSRYFSKGSRMALVGSMQTRSWDDPEGKRQYKTEVVADEVYFAESKSRDSNSNSNTEQPVDDSSDSNGFFPGPDDDTTLPFDI